MRQDRYAGPVNNQALAERVCGRAQGTAALSRARQLISQLGRGYRPFRLRALEVGRVRVEVSVSPGSASTTKSGLRAVTSPPGAHR
jgi:hypothetical protein